jgi:ribonuclease-3
MRELVDHIETVTHHRFADLGMLLRALTHASYAHEHHEASDNERLEFLGDAVVELTTTVLLMERFPDADEGHLTELRQHVVRNTTLGVVGEAMGLEPFVRLGRSESNKARVERAILGDCVEALFGALFREAGLDAAMVVAREWLEPKMPELADEAVTRSAVNRLQEFTQEHFGQLPVYETDHAGLAHQLQWQVTVVVEGEELATGEDRTKKLAKARAARIALEILRRRQASA